MARSATRLPKARPAPAFRVAVVVSFDDGRVTGRSLPRDRPECAPALSARLATGWSTSEVPSRGLDQRLIDVVGAPVDDRRSRTPGTGPRRPSWVHDEPGAVRDGTTRQRSESPPARPVGPTTQSPRSGEQQLIRLRCTCWSHSVGVTDSRTSCGVCHTAMSQGHFCADRDVPRTICSRCRMCSGFCHIRSVNLPYLAVGVHQKRRPFAIYRFVVFDSHGRDTYGPPKAAL